MVFRLSAFLSFLLLCDSFGMRFTTATYWHQGTDSLKADVYAPDSAAFYPCLLMIHEGGFRHGGRDCFAEHGRYFAAKGFVVVSIDYRLLQQGGAYPAPLQDCFEAIRWLKAHALEFRVDKGKIILIGCSAGAYLATMAGLVSGLPDSIRQGHGGYPGENPSVKAVVSCFGVYDWKQSRWKGDGFISKAMEPAASPVRYSQYASGDFLILAGEKDRLFPVAQARAFSQALRQAGKNSELRIMQKQDHGGICNFNGKIFSWALPIVEKFLVKILDKK